MLLSVLFQSDMSLDDHISIIIKSCFMQLRDFRRIRSLISKTSAITLANSLIHSRLCYCNSHFYGLPNYSIHHLQKVQNTAARIVTRIVSVHRTSIRFLNLCISYLLTAVIILRFVASLIVLCFK